jgi:arylsulfatase A-like enzyme
VRFVQLWSGGPFGGPTWDAHDDVPKNHGDEARRIDRPVAGLLKDLRRRGLLDDTLVVFSSEFGRTPFAQSDAGKVGKGRDHNAGGFTTWMAGAGLKPGTAHGMTDEFGYHAVENAVTIADFHATILHLLGIDHERLTHYHDGIRRRLTNVHGRVVRELLA